MLSNVINHASNQVEGFCFIKSLQLKVNVKGAEYLDIMLADADGEINAKLWDYQSAVHGMYSAGEVIKVRGTINLYKDTEQLKIDRIRHITEADHVDMSSIVASAPIDGEKYLTACSNLRVVLQTPTLQSSRSIFLRRTANVCCTIPPR